jgi:hypothetical protein
MTMPALRVVCAKRKLLATDLSAMISDSDIYRAASLLINLHGFDAMVAAAKLLEQSRHWRPRSTGTVH